MICYASQENIEPKGRDEGGDKGPHRGQDKGEHKDEEGMGCVEGKDNGPLACVCVPVVVIPRHDQLNQCVVQNPNVSPSLSHHNATRHTSTPLQYGPYPHTPPYDTHTYSITWNDSIFSPFPVRLDAHWRQRRDSLGKSMGVWALLTRLARVVFGDAGTAASWCYSVRVLVVIIGATDGGTVLWSEGEGG